MKQSDILIIIDISRIREMVNALIRRQSYPLMKEYTLRAISDFIYKNKNQMRIDVCANNNLYGLGHSEDSLELIRYKRELDGLIELGLERFDFVGIESDAIVLDCVVTPNNIILSLMF